MRQKGALVLMFVIVATIVAIVSVCAAWLVHVNNQHNKIRVDNSGTVHGSGAITYSYEDGTPKRIDEYSDGVLLRSTWHYPDGSTVAMTEWNNGTGDEVYLREDGSIRVRYKFVNGIADGPATYYRADGSIEKVVEYEDGSPVTDNSGHMEPPAQKP